MAATQAPLAATGRKAAKNSPPAGDRALFAQWVREEYLGQLRATPAEGGAKYRRFLEEAEREDHRALSGVRRVQSFNVLKYGYPMRPSGYTAAVLVARMAVGKDQIVRTHYAQTYWRPGEALPEYISVSPTYDSRDGEYRGNFLWYPAFAGAYGEQAEALAEVEGMVLEAVQLGDLDLDIEVFPAETYSATANKIRDARIGVAALVVAYALDAARIAAGHQQVHTSRGYVDIMARLHARGAAARGPSPSGGDLSAFEVGRSAARDRAKCGAKLLPLTLRAAASPGDINHHPWREIYIARLCGDLVVNAVAPMFPTFNSWSYIEGADRALFENAQVRRLYDRGEQAESVVAALRAARRGVEASAFAGDPPMETLDAGLYAQIEHTQSYILMSEAALCLTAEHLGPTVASLPNIVRRSPVVTRGDLDFFADPASAARYLFDLLYGAHAMHSRVSVIHGDLHLNNMTLYTLSQGYRGAAGAESLRIEGSSIAYVAGPRGMADTYVFPHVGRFACVIDFSRAVLGPGARARLEDSHGVAYADAFYRDQVNRILRLFHHHLPEYTAKHQEAIKSRILGDYGALFPVLAGVDFLSIAGNLARLLAAEAEKDALPLAEGELRGLGIAKASVALAREAEKMSREFLLVSLHDLLTARRAPAAGGARLSPGEPAGRLPGDVILREIFRDYLFTNVDASALHKKALVDVYKLEGPLTYSGSDASRFPPWGRADDVEVQLAKLRGLEASDVYERGTQPFEDALGMDSGYSLLLERFAQDVGSDRPAESSSWIRV